MMRNWIALTESLQKPIAVFHGTTARLWRSSGKKVNFNLYVTADRNDAISYAEEAVHSKRDKPILVEFQMADLDRLIETGTIEFDPDWGWVTGLEHDLRHQGKKLETLPTWQESLTAVGSFCIDKFSDSLKSFGKVIPL